MDNFTTNLFQSKIQSLLDSQVEFPKKIKEHFVFKSDQVSNPFKFIGGLLSKGVLCDGSNDSEANFGLKEIMVRFAMMMACAKGAEGILGLMEALEESGNSQFISDFRAWIKQNFGTEIETDFGQPKDAGSSAQTKKSEVVAAEARKVNETSSCGAKLVDKIMSRMDDDLIGQLEGLFLRRAFQIINVPEFCASLVNLKALNENDAHLATGMQNEEEWTENFIRVACSKKAIGSLVVAFQTSNNERILTEICELLDPVSVESLAGQQRPPENGLFAATEAGLISLDLRTLEATTLRNEITFAVAVNHNLRKVYWSEGYHSWILRSNFDGSAVETVVQQTGDWIWTLAIDESSGKIYYAPLNSHTIRVCNAHGKNFAVVISDPSLVNNPFDIALDTSKGFMYWGNRSRGSSSHSIVRANLDGSNLTIISTGFQDLIGITLDQPSNGILYWTDFGAQAIGTTDVNDGKTRRLVGVYARPSGIQVDDDKVYFSTAGGTTILSVDKNSGRELATIFYSTGAINHLALFNASVTNP